MNLVTAPPLAMADEQRAALEMIARSTTLGHRKVIQAQALLLAADGVGTNEVARRCHTSKESVRAWRRRFEAEGVGGVGRIAKGRGRRSWLPEGTVSGVVHDTLFETPDDGSTHWTTRLMAKRFGIGKDTVARIWHDHNLKPWKVDTFKVSSDPAFEEKLVDVVGLYLDPPERAVVFSFDEKTQVQALDRTQPSLPMKPGRGGTMTHDYQRHGTTDLFAAMNVATGEVLYDTKKRHTADDVLAFFKLIDLHVAKDLEIHVVLDNLSAHQAPPIEKWLADPRRALAPALHPDLLVVAEPRRGMVQRTHRTPSSPWRVHLGAQPDRGHRDLGRALERRPQALRLAQAGAGDHPQSASRTGRPRPSQLRDAPLAGIHEERSQRWPLTSLSCPSCSTPSSPAKGSISCVRACAW
jgi:transposase